MTSATKFFGSLLAGALLIAAPSSGATSGWSATPSAPAPDPAFLGIRLGRDANGVAHVFASNDRGAYYGAGYAAAEDRLFQMLWSRLIVQGRVSEFFGAGAVVNPLTGVITKTHVISDRKARLFGWTKLAARVVSSMDAPTRNMLQSYADGVNARMSEPNLVLDPLFTQFPLPLEPWTPADCIGAWLRFGEFFASNGLEEAKLMHDWQAILTIPGLTQKQRLEQLLGALVCDDSAAVIEQQDVPLSTQQLMFTYARDHRLSQLEGCLPYASSPHFSQAWAVAGTHTTTGRAVLVGDPRIGVTLPSQLYEWSMQGATFAVRGVGVPGCPNMLSGSTGQVAWSPTAIGLDQSDLLLLRTDPQLQPNRYQLDGQWVDFTATKTEIIHVRAESDVSVLYRESYWGPVVTGAVPNAHADEEYAVRRVPFDDPFRDPAIGFVRLYRAASIEGCFDALEDWTWPSVNLVFADAGGRVGYSVAGTVPVRNPNLVLGGVIAQDGSTTSSDWIDTLPHAMVPHVLDPHAGFVLSANNRPIGAWYPIPIRYGTGGSGDSFRSRRLRELLSSAPQPLDPQDVYALHHDVVSVGGRDLAEIGLWLKNSGVALSTDAKRALTELDPWLQAGAKVDNSVRATLIVWFMNLSFRQQDAGDELVTRYGGGEAGLNLFLKQSLAKIHHTPPVALTPAEIAYVDQVLADAVLEAQLTGPTTQWQAWYQSNALTVFLPKWTSLEGFPSLTPGQNLAAGLFRAVDQNTLLSPLKQSYTQFVELGGPAVQRSVAPPGSAEPGSSHDVDQVNLWRSEQFKPSPLTVLELIATGPVQWKIL